MRRLRAAAAAAATTTWSGVAAQAGVEVELKHLSLPPEDSPASAFGLLVAGLEVGTPSQRLWVQLDTAKAEMWLPEEAPHADRETAGFAVSRSKTAKVDDEAPRKRLVAGDGFPAVEGSLVKDRVGFRVPSTSSLEPSDAEAVEVNFLLAQNVSIRGSDGSDDRPPQAGLLGLVYNREPPGGRIESFFGSELKPSGQAASVDYGHFLDHFFRHYPELPRTFRLELGGPRPSLALGVQCEEAEASRSERLRSEGSVRLLAPTWTERSSLWYVSARAIGLSFGTESPYMRGNRDFNQRSSYGAPALLHSGEEAIRVAAPTFEALASALPGTCTARDRYMGISCDCDPSRIEQDFPSLSISLESNRAYRVLGLDSGDDINVCIPPSAYITADSSGSRCTVAIVDGGRQITFGHESIVLGKPFFRSVSVTFDIERQIVGIGKTLPVPAPVTSRAATRSDDGDAEVHGAAPVTSLQQFSEKECRCADPKYWWSTGKRLSLRRVVVVLLGTALLSIYIFVAHSPSEVAQRLRSFAQVCCGEPDTQPGLPGQGTYLAPGQHSASAGGFSGFGGNGAGSQRPLGTPGGFGGRQGGGRSQRLPHNGLVQLASRQQAVPPPE